MVERCSVEAALLVLRRFSESTERARKHMHALSLVFPGYEDDPRELPEIPEVRAFLKAIDRQWPYWYCFLSLADESLLILEASLCVTLEDLQASMLYHFEGMNEIFSRLGISEEYNRTVTDEIVELIVAAAPSPDSGLG